MPTVKPKTIYLKDYRPTPYLIDEVELAFHLAPQATRVVSKLSLKPNLKVKKRGALRLDGKHIKLISVSLNGKLLSAVSYTVDTLSLTLTKPPNKRFTLEIETECAPQENTALSGLYMSNGVYCTQCEAEGFRRITYFYDRPDVLSIYTVRIQAPKTLPVLLSNGNPVASGPVADTDCHIAWWHDPHPKPCYLFALVAGNLAKVEGTFTTIEGRDVGLGIYVEQGKQDRCDWAMKSLKAAMKWDEDAFKRAYDLDVFNIVAVSDFNMGAMENKGLNIFNDKYILARADTATDTDFELIETIIAHEYFHNWTGNRITCRDWFQLCLKEGLTVFRDQEFTSDLRSRAVKRIDDVQDLRSRQLPEDMSPLQHPPRPSQYVEINNFYTATVYDKGAEICRMLKCLLGHKTFARGMQLYFKRHDGQAATVEDFIKCFEDTSRKSLKQFFRWYEQAGTPVVSVIEKYSSKRGIYSLTVSQNVNERKGQKVKKPLHIPIEMGLLLPDGKSLHSSFELKTPKKTVTFRNMQQKPILSFNRGYAGAFVTQRPSAFEDQLHITSHDDDSFNRWEATQTLAHDLVVNFYRNGNSAKWQKLAASFATALRAPLLSETLEPAYRAKLLDMPELVAMAQSLKRNVDSTRLEMATQTLRATIGAALGSDLEKLYHANASAAAYVPDSNSNGKRSLRGAVLALAADAKAQWVTDALRRQFAARANMTEEFKALRVATVFGGKLAKEMVQEFHDRHQHEPLLMDKWFAAQALVPATETVQRVHKLTKHAAFNLKTPNRVYALLRNFIGGNFSGFHSADGAGYALAAEMIIKLDAINPQVASRLATGFRTWRLFDATRRKNAQAKMKEILTTKDLSRDVHEIISRTLKA